MPDPHLKQPHLSGPIFAHSCVMMPPRISFFPTIAPDLAGVYSLKSEHLCDGVDFQSASIPPDGNGRMRASDAASAYHALKGRFPHSNQGKDPAVFPMFVQIPKASVF